MDLPNASEADQLPPQGSRSTRSSVSSIVRSDISRANSGDKTRLPSKVVENQLRPPNGKGRYIAVSIPSERAYEESDSITSISRQTSENGPHDDSNNIPQTEGKLVAPNYANDVQPDENETNDGGNAIQQDDSESIAKMDIQKSDNSTNDDANVNQPEERESAAPIDSKSDGCGTNIASNSIEQDDFNSMAPIDSHTSANGANDTQNDILLTESKYIAPSDNRTPVNGTNDNGNAIGESLTRQIAAFCHQLPTEESVKSEQDYKSSLNLIKRHANELFSSIQEQEGIMFDEKRETQHKIAALQKQLNDKQQHTEELQEQLQNSKNAVENLEQNLNQIHETQSKSLSRSNSDVWEEIPRLRSSKKYTLDDIDTSIRTLQRELFKWEGEKAKLDENLQPLVPKAKVAKLQPIFSPRAELKPSICPMSNFTTFPEKSNFSMNQWAPKPLHVIANDNASQPLFYKEGTVEHFAKSGTENEIENNALLKERIEQLQKELNELQQKMRIRDGELANLKKMYDTQKKTSYDRENILKIQLTEVKDRNKALARSLQLRNINMKI